MKLSDIVITEADELKATEGAKLVELSDIVKYFPNTYQKAANALMNKGRLTFNGELLYKDGDRTTFLDQAISHAENELKQEEIEMSFEIDGTVGDIDDSGAMEYSAKVDSVELEYVGYDVVSNSLLIGFDVWISEDDFNNEWDKSFERIFGIEFDSEDENHSAIFDHVWDEYIGRNGKKGRTFFGAIVEVDTELNADPERIFDGGLHKNWILDQPKESAIARLASSPEARKKISDRSGKIRKPATRSGRRIIDLS